MDATESRREAEELLRFAEEAGLVRVERTREGFVASGTDGPPAFEITPRGHESSARLLEAAISAVEASRHLSTIAEVQVRWPESEVVLELRSDDPGNGGVMRVVTAAALVAEVADPDAREGVFHWVQATKPADGELRFFHVDESCVPRVGFFLGTRPAREMPMAMFVGTHDTLEFHREREDWGRLRENVQSSQAGGEYLERARPAGSAALSLCAALSERSVPATDLGQRVFEAARYIEESRWSAGGLPELSVDQVVDFLCDLSAYEEAALGRDWWNPRRSALGCSPPVAFAEV